VKPFGLVPDGHGHRTRGPDAHRLQVQPAENGSAVVLALGNARLRPVADLAGFLEGVANQPMAVPEVLGPPLTGSAVPD
jgi:hypothetical protein